MSNSIIKLQLYQIATAYIFVIILLFITKYKGISREKEILISTLRMTLQLTLTGYILVYIFEIRHPICTLSVICVMECFSIFNVFHRVKHVIPLKIKKVIAISMILGPLAALFYFIIVVIRLSPWYEPRYFIPIAGMIIGNAMTAVSLATNRLLDGVYSQKQLIEAALMLGATPKAAIKSVMNSTFDASILPTINSMVGMGIVSLPGMMTGQILSGTSPIIAIQYQIAIMLGILGSTSLTITAFLHLSHKVLFNEDSQLSLEE